MAQVQDLAPGFVELREVHIGSYLILSRTLWMASPPTSESAAPLSLVSAADFLKEHSILLFMSLMEVLNYTGPGRDPEGTSLFTRFHLDTETLTVILCTQPSRQFFIPLKVHPSN